MKIDLSKTKNPLSPSEAFSEMLGGDGKTGVMQIPINQLHPYPNQPFHKYSDEKLAELAEDIRQNGILSPVIVRPAPANGDGYQILAGHNRTAAATLAGLDTVPCLIKDVDDDTAALILTTTNLNQRDKLLYSEKAFAYKLQMEATNRQGKRNDLIKQDEPTDQTLRTMCAKLIPDSESKRNIQYYIRLTVLVKSLLDMVDSENIPFRAGVNLSYLDEKSQYLLGDYITENKKKVTLKQSAALREIGRDGEITYEDIVKVFEKKTKELAPREVSLPLKDIRYYFGDADEDEIIEKVLHIIKQHFNDDMPGE